MRQLRAAVHALVLCQSTLAAGTLQSVLLPCVACCVPLCMPGCFPAAPAQSCCRPRRSVSNGNPAGAGISTAARRGRCRAQLSRSEPLHVLRPQQLSLPRAAGGTPQANGWMRDWVSFFAERRLRPQLEQTGRPSLQRMGDKLIQNLGSFFEGVEVSSRHPSRGRPDVHRCAG